MNRDEAVCRTLCSFCLYLCMFSEPLWMQMKWSNTSGSCWGSVANSLSGMTITIRKKNCSEIYLKASQTTVVYNTTSAFAFL